MIPRENNNSAAAERRCPICDEPFPGDADSAPFCSARCRLVDLGKWLKGDYVISREIKDADIEQGE